MEQATCCVCGMGYDAHVRHSDESREISGASPSNLVATHQTPSTYSHWVCFSCGAEDDLMSAA